LPQPGERGGEVGGPGPVDVDAQPPGPAGFHESGGDVADAVAERGGFAAGQMSGEAQRLGPGEQIGCGQGQFKPDPVLLVAFAGYLESSGDYP